MRYDIDITGRGFYTIQGNTPRGAAFMRKVQGTSYDVAHSDDTGMTQNIADGAIRRGLLVRVNGCKYLGNNRVSRK